MAAQYAIASLDEAKAYLKHPVLASRLLECCALLLAHAGTPIEDIMGWPDDLKLRSSMTLFAKAAQNDSTFSRMLEVFFSGQMDEKTFQRL